MSKQNRYRVVVDYFNDKFSRDKIEQVSEHKTLKEARAACNDYYKHRHFSCKYNYYVQSYNGGHWKFVSEAPKLTYKIDTVQDLETGKKIKLPIEVTLTRSQTKSQIGSAIEIIKQLVEKWPGEKK